MTTAANGLFSAINLTRSEAIKRGARVELVPIHGGGDWESGWAVLVDKNNNHRADAGDEVIFTHGPVHGGIKIESNQPGSAVQFLAYNGTGRAPPRSFRFILDGQLKRKISINFLGRPKVCNPATDDGNC
jgi:type IV fimbrial biogenesis protein FimT